jgi:hypothetical protein
VRGGWWKQTWNFCENLALTTEMRNALSAYPSWGCIWWLVQKKIRLSKKKSFSDFFFSPSTLPRIFSPRSSS